MDTNRAYHIVLHTLRTWPLNAGRSANSVISITVLYIHGYTDTKLTVT